MAFLGRKALEYAEKWAQKDIRARGTWAGECIDFPVDTFAAVQSGYSQNTPCVFVRVVEENPLRFVHESGTEYMVSDGVSDGGSTPPLVRDPAKAWADLEPFGKFKYAFYLHDGMYREAGVFVRKDSSSKWEWMRVNRQMADLLFFQSMTACDGHNAEVRAIYAAVRAGASIAWRRHRDKSSSNESLPPSCNSEKR